MTQSQYYESVADGLVGVDKARALRAAQNHLDAASPQYLADFKRLESKLTEVCK